jgi:hypothetical protein
MIIILLITSKSIDMKTTEVNESIIGKRCKCIFTGLMVTGTMEEIKIGKLFYISFVISQYLYLY